MFYWILHENTHGKSVLLIS